MKTKAKGEGKEGGFRASRVSIHTT